MTQVESMGTAIYQDNQHDFFKELKRIRSCKSHSSCVNGGSATVGIRCIQPLDVFILTPIVNESCNTQCCVNNMHQIIQNMMFPQGLELELSMFIEGLLSGQHHLV